MLVLPLVMLLLFQADLTSDTKVLILVVTTVACIGASGLLAVWEQALGMTSAALGVDDTPGLSRAACRNRTDDLLITSEMLYRLS